MTSTVLAAEFSATTTYSNTAYLLLLYAFVVAAFALFAAGLYGVKTASEVSKAYRASAIASTCICWVATAAYAVLIIEWVTNFSPTPDGLHYAPARAAVITELRYMDWSVTVPLLTVELLAVAALTRAQTIRWRTAAVVSAALMIVTGFLGVIFGQDALRGVNAAMWVWGAISTAFFVVLYVVAARAYRASTAALSPASSKSYRAALILLFTVFLAYPLAYLVPWWAGADNPGWATAEQLTFTIADIAAKAGFGLLIHRTAKLRTAHDAEHAASTPHRIAAAVPDTMASEVWISGELLSVPPAPTQP
ncbi:xanthorhodopsin [Mycolicibacterium madagascariense]|uniref:Xanthorhodopsin n=1 Tax=Mycolicibacterium madagascariense TaxID=212765 RepID=A0A7I7XH82_9MYCO|nr:bacteriorhodopsin [Mycolicibacterium madagascariense]MCV7014341.1 bacteriorhodopsin [Mycolicibacterium madagascariense]BBZ28568.1 xanthorhodopsin [Mycolicibacterium madagascariense]